MYSVATCHETHCHSSKTDLTSNLRGVMVRRADVIIVVHSARDSTGAIACAPRVYCYSFVFSIKTK